MATDLRADLGACLARMLASAAHARNGAVIVPRSDELADALIAGPLADLFAELDALRTLAALAAGAPVSGDPT